MKKLIQMRWFRQMFSNQSYYLISGTWVRSSKFKIGDKIEDVSGPWYSLNFCECKNELSHSKSFVGADDKGIWEYKCTHCGKHQYKNGTLGPFILESDEDGVPIGI
jgi:hypothetical protein